jgi:UDP-glucuronate 4-epimerase
VADACLVTGAAGFIGSHLAAALVARGRRVIGIDNFDPYYARDIKLANLVRVQGQSEHRGFELIEADLRDRDAIAGVFHRVKPATVFHLAALAGVRPSIDDPARYLAVNVGGLSNVLDAARASGCRTFIFASSSSVYGNSAPVPFHEDDPCAAPISPYAATKRAGELLGHVYADRFGLRFAALRFFTVYGPSQRPDLAISRFMQLIAGGDEVPMFGDGSTMRDYSYIDDIIAGVLAAEPAISDQRAAPFRIWNLGSDRPISLRGMIDSIATVVGRPARLVRRPMQPGDVDRTWADLARSRMELGYEPRTSFEVGLAQQWAWLQPRLAGVMAPR